MRRRSSRLSVHYHRRRGGTFPQSSLALDGARLTLTARPVSWHAHRSGCRGGTPSLECPVVRPDGCVLLLHAHPRNPAWGREYRTTTDEHRGNSSNLLILAVVQPMISTTTGTETVGPRARRLNNITVHQFPFRDAHSVAATWQERNC